MEALMHPKIVHLPMALSVLMPIIAAVVAVAWWRGWLPRRTWLLVVLLQAIFSVTGFMALASGEEDEEFAEEVVAHKIIHEHEEAAETFFWASTGVLVVSVVAAATAPPVALGAAGLTVVGGLVVLALGIQVGSLGGGLVYEHGAASAFIDAAKGGGAKGKHHDDDEHGKHDEHDDDDD